MRKTICILLTILCVITSLGCLKKDESKQWYFKRKGNGETTVSYSEEFLQKYNIYWKDLSGEKNIYLTFDAGYINDNVLKILEILKEEDVTAAFFILGHPLLKNRDVIQRIKKDGHLVCNHTKNHKDITKMGREELLRNIHDMEKIYEEKMGFEIDKYFRPPEGKFSEESLLVLKEAGYKNIFWSFAYADWDEQNQMSDKKALDKLKNNLHAGEILLLHPTSKTNAQILKDFIRYAKAEGYSFCSLDNLK